MGVAEDGRFSKCVTRIPRLLKWGGMIPLGYIAILLIGLVPVNTDFVPPDDGVTIYLVSNALHADIIVPREHDVVDWSEEFKDAIFQGDTSLATHVAFGWGDRAFFLETPTWGDLKLSTAAKALLFPSESCVHVALTRPEYLGDDVSSVTITQRQYQQLAVFIKGTFASDSPGGYSQIPDAFYSSNDAFFKANGRYHALNTCNSWAGRGLKSSGVKVPLLTPMPKTPVLYLPES